MALDTDSKQRKELAKTLFLNSELTQAEIAEKVGVSRISVVRWAKEWEGLKLTFMQTRDARIKSTLQQLDELDRHIASREEGKRFPTAREADTRRKLTADLEALEQDASVREVVNVARGILDYVRAHDLEKAKELSDYIDAYIKERMKWAK
ncbi:helix-turn-helix domain-containing protein [uncultured Alistipes sp.]|uniref:helix-turn-helix domain-containing protein n=1 Tax=uncultured Alistipes sp. TaxID=538949 RepID=UPI0025DBFFDA|nr:helix-turn-helix domain-containing protein [uncultured Alistipes sp.]